jgi:hypothetical protein
MPTLISIRVRHYNQVAIIKLNRNALSAIGILILIHSSTNGSAIKVHAATRLGVAGRILPAIIHHHMPMKPTSLAVINGRAISFSQVRRAAGLLNLEMVLCF